MIYRILLIFLLFAPDFAFGTAQSSDVLLHNGKIHRVHHFRLNDESEANFEVFKNENFDKFYIPSTNWDGIYYKLQIRSKKLYVLKVEFDCDPIDCSNIKKAIGIAITKEGLFADWFSGELIEYFGEHYVAHVYSHTRAFLFKNGILVGVSERKTEGFENYRNKENNN